LTLPFISYGGSSLIMSCVTIAILLRIGLENTQAQPEGGRT
jgi:cell division protein FtsW